MGTYLSVAASPTAPLRTTPIYTPPLACLAAIITAACCHARSPPQLLPPRCRHRCVAAVANALTT